MKSAPRTYPCRRAPGQLAAEHIDNYDAPFAQQFLVIATDMAGVAQKTIAQVTEVAADLAVLVPAFAQAVNGK